MTIKKVLLINLLFVSSFNAHEKKEPDKKICLKNQITLEMIALALLNVSETIIWPCRPFMIHSPLKEQPLNWHKKNEN